VQESRDNQGPAQRLKQGGKDFPDENTHANCCQQGKDTVVEASI
jgi:hypothetical protein